MPDERPACTIVPGQPPASAQRVRPWISRAHSNEKGPAVGGASLVVVYGPGIAQFGLGALLDAGRPDVEGERVLAGAPAE